MSGLLAGIGTAFGAASGAAAVSVGATLVGGIISGIGTAMMERSRDKREEQARINEEKRREARYAGIGGAARIAGGQQLPGITTTTTGTEVAAQQHIDPHKPAGTPLGQTDLGQGQSTAPPKTRFAYDPASGTIKKV